MLYFAKKTAGDHTNDYVEFCCYHLCFRAAQRELYSLARMAEFKVGAGLTSSSGDVDLDKMFTFLAEAPKQVKEEKDFLTDLNKELDTMFQASQVS